MENLILLAIIAAIFGVGYLFRWYWEREEAEADAQVNAFGAALDLAFDKVADEFDEEESRDERHNDLIANGITIGWTENGDVGLWRGTDKNAFASGDTLTQVIEQATAILTEGEES